MINNLQNTIRTQYGGELLLRTQYIRKIKKKKKTEREKLKLEAAGDGASETAALVALTAYRFKGTRIFAVVVT